MRTVEANTAGKEAGQRRDGASGAEMGTYGAELMAALDGGTAAPHLRVLFLL